MCNLSKAFLIPSLVFSIFCFSALPTQAKYGGGSGTAEDPYLIKTAEQMNTIGANPSDWDKHFKQMENIDLRSFTAATFNIIGKWTAWGAIENQSFSGVFDGNGKTISNLSYTSSTRNGVALFTYVRGRIENLGLVNPRVVAQGSNVASLVGYLDEGRITNCYAKDIDVFGGIYVGGLVGTNDGTIASCYTSGRVWGDAYAGGLTGLLGDGLVTNCYSTAAVSGNENVGGLVGITDHEFSTISDSYAIGDVTGNIYVGGLAGQFVRGAAAKCYSAGKITANQYAGGFVGYKRILVMVWNCFWDVQASGQTTSADGTGKTTAQMQTASTFSNSGWDFFSNWTICEGMNYPILLWQIPIGDFRCPDGVNMIDFAWFAQRWRQNNCTPANSFCSGMDLNQSGSVNFFDLAVFADHWLEGVTH